MSIVLTPRESKVYEMRQAGILYRVIAESIGLSSSRAQQIYHKACRKLRYKAMREEMEIENKAIQSRSP